MKNPFNKHTDATDQSIWADWLSDDVSKQKSGQRPLRAPEASRPRPIFPSTSSQHKNTTVSPKPLVLDPKKFQEQRTQAFLSKQAPKTSSLPSKPSSNRREIALSIQLPHIPLNKIKQWRPSKLFIVRGAVGLGLVVLATGIFLTPKIINSNDTSSTNASAGGGLENIPKSFAELKPEDAKNVSNERYDASRGFYAFNDRYKSANITVSEQPLPDTVRDNPEKGKELAKSVGALEDFETTNGTMYLTLSDTKTSQRAVVLHRQLLIFIQSTEPLDAVSWVDYVQSLQ